MAAFNEFLIYCSMRPFLLCIIYIQYWGFSQFVGLGHLIDPDLQITKLNDPSEFLCIIRNVGT